MRFLSTTTTTNIRWWILLALLFVLHSVLVQDSFLSRLFILYSQMVTFAYISIGVHCSFVYVLDKKKIYWIIKEKLLLLLLLLLLFSLCKKKKKKKTKHVSIHFTFKKIENKRRLYAMNSAIITKKKMLQTIYITITLPSYTRTHNPYKMNRTLLLWMVVYVYSAICMLLLSSSILFSLNFFHYLCKFFGNIRLNV